MTIARLWPVRSDTHCTRMSRPIIRRTFSVRNFLLIAYLTLTAVLHFRERNLILEKTGSHKTEHERLSHPSPTERCICSDNISQSLCSVETASYTDSYAKRK